MTLENVKLEHLEGQAGTVTDSFGTKHTVIIKKGNAGNNKVFVSIIKKDGSIEDLEHDIPVSKFEPS